MSEDSAYALQRALNRIPLECCRITNLNRDRWNSIFGRDTTQRVVGGWIVHNDLWLQ